MTKAILTDQATIHRILLENGMLDHIKPADPDNPGCVAMFPDKRNPSYDHPNGTYYIVDKGHDYTMCILQGCNLEQAYAAFAEFNQATEAHGPIHVSSPTHNPENN